MSLPGVLLDEAAVVLSADADALPATDDVVVVADVVANEIRSDETAGVSPAEAHELETTAGNDAVLPEFTIVELPEDDDGVADATDVNDSKLMSVATLSEEWGTEAVDRGPAHAKKYTLP